MKTHPTDLVSLVPGLAFVAIAAAALAGAVELDLVVDLRWLWPALLVGLGLVLLAGAGRDRAPVVAATTPAEPSGDAPGTDLDTAADAGSEEA